MIKSMTGYAAAEVTAGEITISTDIRSYNSRHLDVVLRVPAAYTVLEDKIKGLIADRIDRGRVEVRVQVKDEAEEAMAFEIDRPRAQAIYSSLTQLKNEFNLQNEISMDLLLSVGGIIKPIESLREADAIWPAIEDCLSRALEDLESMRKKEGDFIAADLSRRLDYIDDCISEIGHYSEELLNYYQERLK